MYRTDIPPEYRTNKGDRRCTSLKNMVTDAGPIFDPRIGQESVFVSGEYRPICRTTLGRWCLPIIGGEAP